MNTITLTHRYRHVATTPYSPVTDHDGAAAGGTVCHEARLVNADTVRVRRTASAGCGVHQASATEDFTLAEFIERYRLYCI